MKVVSPPTVAAGPQPVVTRRRGVSARALLISAVLMPLNTLFLVHANLTVGYFTGGESLFANAVGALLLLTMLNVALKRWRPALAFAPGEMLTVYLLLGLETGLTGAVWDLGGALAANITYPFRFANATNNWSDTVWPNLPTWLTVRDPDVLEGFYLGESSPYSWTVIRAWLAPALWWAGIISALMWVCLCLNSAVRRRWDDEEKLSFPLTILPVQLVDEHIGILRSRLFWLGAGIAGALTIWNTLAGLFPSLPAVPLGINYRTYLQHPWGMIRYPLMEWTPWIVGLCYLIPPDLAFSLLIFDLFWMAQYVGSGYMGWATSQWGGFPFGDEQATGGLLALMLLALWLDRKYLTYVAKQALGRAGAVGSGDEAMSYRTAALGVLVGAALLCLLLLRAGMGAWVAPAFLILYFTLSLVMSRLRAQLGAPALALYHSMPNYILGTLVGTRSLGVRSLSLFALMGPYLREQRNNPVPLQLEALKMAEGGRMERRRLAYALTLAVPAAMLCYFWASLHFGYRIGLSSSGTHRWNLWVPGSYFSELDDSLRSPSGTDVSGTIAMAIGMAFTVALMILKLRFQWWPLHPVAYPLAISTTIENMTVAIFVTWLIKSLLLRYGGLRSYRASLPLFLGLLAGGATITLLQRLFYDAIGLRVVVYG